MNKSKIAFRGKLERLSGREVVGWIWDPNSPDSHVSFLLIVNGVAVGRFIADRLRMDLKAHGIGKGDHGFRVSLQDAWLSEGQNRIIVIADQPFAASPAVLCFVGRTWLETDVHRIDLRTEEIGGGGLADYEMVKKFDSNYKWNEKKENSPKKKKIEIKEEEKSNTKKAVIPITFLVPSNSPRLQPGRNGPSLIPVQRVGDLLRILSASGNLSVKQIGTVMDELFRASRFEDIILLAEANKERMSLYYPVLNFWGRSYLNVGRSEEAAVVFERLYKFEPKRHNALYYFALALMRIQNFKYALEVIDHCLSYAPEEGKYHLEAGRAALGLTFGGYGVLPQQDQYLERSIISFREAIRFLPDDYRAYRDLAGLMLHQGRMIEAYDLMHIATQKNPSAVNVWNDLASLCLRINRLSEANEALDEVLKRDPTNERGNFGMRILQRFRRHDNIATEKTSLLTDEFLTTCTFEQALNACSDEWVAFSGSEEWEAQFDNILALRDFHWAAGIALCLNASPKKILWRRTFLLRLLRIGTQSSKSVDDVLDLAVKHGAIVRTAEDVVSKRPKKPVAILLSQFGIKKFGGAEQFLEQMAHLYVRLGFDVLLVGTRAEFIGEEGRHGDIRYTFVENDPDKLFRLAIAESAYLVHVVSGLGLELAVAMRWLDTRLIFGVHFWRELFHHPTPSSGYYPDIDKGFVARPEFQIVVEDYSVIYANSIYVRQLLENTFGVRTPIIYSLPDDWDDPEPIPLEHRSGVLLANARSDKGFTLMLEVAAQLPDISFSAIVTQSGRSVAEAEISSRGLDNVTLLPRVENMAPLYRKARVVLVPSYRFVETFSRVVIEAHRLGSPVIGSDRGNVPLLLEQTGTILPEDSKAWASEIGRLCHDDKYWTQQSLLALKNSERYSFAQQYDRLAHIVNAIDAPILIGVGSGLGNVIHTTPLIRNIAIRTGRRVDVVVAGDYADLLFCVANSEYVNQVFLMTDAVIRRRYDTVFLTHSFGFLVPRFSARRVFNSREWDTFRPNHSMHEAEFNLAAASALMGIPYDESDVVSYYLGNYSYRPPLKPLIGFHGGSKGGIWASKRWPHYEELARRLVERGYEVASFGTPSEYVAGTIDMTGGSIEEMVQRMLACSTFVSNDSGVMNVANALDIPLVALFAPTNVTTRGPLGKNSVSISIDKECSPCEMGLNGRESNFRSGNCHCIGDIPVEKVLETLKFSNGL